MDAALAELGDRIRLARDARAPVRLRGAGTKDFYGEELRGEVLDTHGYRGIVSYEPSELVVTARCGTPLSELEHALGEHGQFLAFEPPRFGGDPTLGGIVACGLSGPRRASAGAVRDFVLGASMLDGDGGLLRFGGQVMKNVAGFDVSRLLCGSLGVLGLITEVSLKVLPLPRTEVTLRFELDATRAIEQFNRWCAQPLPVSATAWHEGAAYLRISGAASAVQTAARALGGESLTELAARAWWNGVRDQTLDAFKAPKLWRVSLPSTAAFDLPGVVFVEWAGALRWLTSDAPANEIRTTAAAAGGHASLWRSIRDTTMFQPLDTANLQLHRRLKARFDPHGIFNPGRLIAGL